MECDRSHFQNAAIFNLITPERTYHRSLCLHNGLDLALPNVIAHFSDNYRPSHHERFGLLDSGQLPDEEGPNAHLDQINQPSYHPIEVSLNLRRHDSRIRWW